MVVTHGALQATRGRCALTIGNFDGVHRGHRALIDRVAAKARELKLASCVLTFEPHPREFFSRDAAPARLTRVAREELARVRRSEEHTSELQSLRHLVCRLLLEKKKKKK